CISDYVAKANGGITDRAVVNGDLINLDYAGYKDGEAFGGGTATNQLLGIGTGQFIEGFEEGLVGVKPGETVDLELKFPEKYHSADLAGAEVVFTCTVNFIIPTEKEIKDETIQSFGIEGVTNAQELRSYVTDYMQTDLEEQFESAKSNLVLQEFIAGCTFGELPQDRVAMDAAQTRETLEMQANAYGMDVSLLVQYMYGVTDVETFIQEYAESATMQLLAAQAVANKEGLSISDEELDSLLQEYATAGGYATVEEYCGDTDKESFREYFMYDKVLKFLVENATITN
ncbi:MAG: FKBP-type peptidyl-prolyl cis-trans isomerase, partial [Lachnospiraceae bacterium]|nr:FKBP-type peptidyl-prolyl cis-trans isomerase [Lachnospiraceae bacterium]